MHLQVSDLQQWYQQAPGNWLLQLEQQQLDKWLPLIRGASVLQLGGLPNLFEHLLDKNPQEFYFLSDDQQSGADILAAYDELPLRPNSINLALLVHVLEFMDHPSLLLKEVFDVLTPNGKMLLFCFNPWSLWGLHKSFCNTAYPWQGKFPSPARLQQWLRAIGYHNIKDKTLGFRAPFIRRSLTRSALFFEALGQIAIPMLGAVNVFLVEKRVYGSLKEARYAWQKSRLASNGIVEPTTRVVNELQRDE